MNSRFDVSKMNFMFTRAGKDKSFKFDDITTRGFYIAGGAYGSVYELKTKSKNNDMYVIKEVYMKTDNDLKNFLKEIDVGSNILLSKQKVGPAIYAYTYRQRTDKTKGYLGYYIMDNVKMGEKDLESMPMSRYLGFYERDNDVRVKAIKLMKESLLKFYKITQGYHGDLHMSNVIVLYKENLRKDPVRVMIIDYGAHIKFKEQVKNNTTLEMMLNVINAEHKANYKKYKKSVIHPPGSGVRSINDGVCQLYRSNRQMLMKVDPVKPGMPLNKKHESLYEIMCGIPAANVPKESFVPSKCMTYTKPYLVNLAKSRKLAYSGTKKVLCDRLTKSNAPMGRINEKASVPFDIMKCMRYRKDVLIRECAKRGLKTTGIKESLCERLYKGTSPNAKPNVNMGNAFNVTKCMSYKKDVLVQQCKKRKLKVSGNKSELCDRLKKFG